MSGAKEIRTKIKSVQSTKKITRAMEMVAASKMRKTQERMAKAKPYARKIFEMIGHLAHSHSEYHHVFFDQREVKRVGYIVVSTDRGLCGGLNANLFKTAIKDMKQWHDREIEIDLCLIGAKGQAFFRRFGGNMVASASHLGDQPALNDLIGIVKVMLDNYEAGKIDALYIVTNEFVNTMSQQPHVDQLLPLKASDDEAMSHHWDYIYEPDAKELIDMTLTRYIESQVYCAVIENIACEQAAKMVAMKSASDNAGKIIDELQLAYNKARQAMITQELSEIVAGAAAV